MMKAARFPALLSCHRIPERCFHFRGRQFPVCSRCLGVAIGELAAYLLMILYPLSMWAAFLLLLPMACDWSLQAFSSVRSTNVRRLATGFLGGMGAGVLQVTLVLWILSSFWTLL